jgi:DNA-3-methyladenine glycosylase II
MIRGLGMLDVFPADDPLATGYLRQMLKLTRKPAYEDVKLLARAWHPYEGFVYLHLLLEWFRNGGLVK